LFFCLNAKEPKSQVVAKLPPHLPDAGPLPRQPTAPTRIAIVVNDLVIARSSLLIQMVLNDYEVVKPLIAMGETHGKKVTEQFPSRPEKSFGNGCLCGRMETIFILFP
jgi:hypothetical protein